MGECYSLGVGSAMAFFHFFLFVPQVRICYRWTIKLYNAID